jgi:hypothetical protein
MISPSNRIVATRRTIICTRFLIVYSQIVIGHAVFCVDLRRPTIHASVHHVGKERLELDRERPRGRLWVPDEHFGQDFRPLVAGTPALDDARVQVDDPILRNILGLIDPPLALPVGARGRRRQNLDGKQQ